MSSIHFKGLNEIRAVAAHFVVFHHIEIYKYRTGMANLYDTPLRYFIGQLGTHGVYIFFVLSGFLITYLLLQERSVSSTIDVRKFYMRRILRIWPLYYLIVALSFGILPLMVSNIDAFHHEEHYYGLIGMLMESPWMALTLFLLFLPNLALYMRPAVVGASQAWSVGVEEQFYLLWPHIIKHLRKRSYLLGGFVLILSIPILVSAVKLIHEGAGGFLELLTKILPIHFMGIGAIGAFFYFYYKERTERIFMNPYLYLINTALLVGMLMYPVKIPFQKVVFGILALNQLMFIIQPNFKINLRSSRLSWLGNVSYGIYMFHPMVIYLLITWINSIFPDSHPIIYNLAIYGAVLIFTYLASFLSFRFYEKRFIELKKRKFTVVESGG